MTGVITKRDRSSGRSGLRGLLGRALEWTARSAGFVRELTRAIVWKRGSRKKARHLAHGRRAEKQRRKELVRQAMEHRRRRAA